MKYRKGVKRNPGSVRVRKDQTGLSVGHFWKPPVSSGNHALLTPAHTVVFSPSHFSSDKNTCSSFLMARERSRTLPLLGHLTLLCRSKSSKVIIAIGCQWTDPQLRKCIVHFYSITKMLNQIASQYFSSSDYCEIWERDSLDFPLPFHFLFLFRFQPKLMQQ